MSETSGKSFKEDIGPSRFKILAYKTIAYYKKHGLWRTICIVWIKLKVLLAAPKKMQICSFEAAASQISSATRLKKVSFMVGMVEGESKRYRVFNIVEGLQSRGISCCVFHESNAEELEPVLDSDLAIIFRARMSPRVDAVIKKLNAAGVPVVFDIDDLIFDPRYVNCLDEARDLPRILQESFVNDFIKYRQVLERCRLATCTTETIASLIRQTGKTCYVVPNTINRAQYELAETIIKNEGNRGADRVKIGYFSGTRTHDRDFLEAAGALEKILPSYHNIELHIVGTLRLPGVISKMEGKKIKKLLMSSLEMLRYLSLMDINIAPLEQNNIFTDGKSELKIFEAALVGVPTIASRTASYNRCIADGQNGFLAGSGEEWLQKLTSMVENEGLRKEMGLKARQDFTARFYIENAINDIIRIYETIATDR